MKHYRRIGKRAIVAVIIFIGVSLFGQVASATDDTEGLVRSGDIIPAFSVPVPKDKGHRSYLGLEKGDTFKPADLEAQMIIIEVLNLY